MKPFENLTFAGQFRRLRQLVLNVLTAYDIHEPYLTMLQHEGNSTFRIDLASGANARNRQPSIEEPEITFKFRINEETTWVHPPIPSNQLDLSVRS